MKMVKFRNFVEFRKKETLWRRNESDGHMIESIMEKVFG